MINTTNNIQDVAVSLDNGQEVYMGFVTRGQSPTLPYGATWENPRDPWYWRRPATDANVFAECVKAFPKMNNVGEPQPQPTGYALIDHDERQKRWAKTRGN